ncbi:hypothetical protein N5J44_17275 [Acinetobacter ursingii]|nr:hypothetical protein [Acinetobacter ursingii]MDH2020905.1 hypothetical protein [Acinetobacter ursingii]MDH2073253.1 hypothetical protein [Acinetobacter ursingii]
MEQTMVVLHLSLSRVLKRNISKKGSVKTRQHNALNPYSSSALSFSKNGKDAAMYAELGQCQDPLHLRVRWLDDKTFILIEKVRLNETSPPRSFLYKVKSINQDYVQLTEIWTGWGDSKDDTLGYYFR